MKVSMMIPVAIIMTIVFASAFVYNPITLTVTATSPPVAFQSGTNAGNPDIGDSNTIAVSLGANSTSAQISVHPTYQATYYKDVLQIKNTGTKTYYITLKVENPLSGLPAGSKAVMYVFASGSTRNVAGWDSSNLAPSTTPLASIDLTSSGATAIFSLNSNTNVEVDILVYIPEGTSLPANPLTANIYMVYSPVNEPLP